MTKETFLERYGMLLAYVAGYEVWAELLVREPIPLQLENSTPGRRCCNRSWITYSPRTR